MSAAIQEIRYTRERATGKASYFTEVSPQRVFYHVGGTDLEKLNILTEIFNRILTPLYGSQEKALRQIQEGRDRTCFLLYEKETPVGVLVFKTELSDEFAEYQVRASVELKSLFIDQSIQNSGRGLGSALIDKLKAEVAKLELPYQGIHVTVSETKQESLLFFRKKGFEIKHEWPGRYTPGVTEYLLSCPARITEQSKGVNALTQRLDHLLQERQLTVGSEHAPELIHIIHDAHFDDIHTLNRLSDGTFISGSKDNSIYRWSRNGELLQTILEVEPTNRTERNWITAIEVINDEYWVSGERSGRMLLWKTNGEYIRELKLKLPRQEHVSNEFNARRINCLAHGLNPQRPSVFVGFPTIFDEYNLIEGRTSSSTTVHRNDWVYCLHPLSDDRILAVVGSKIDLWSKINSQWQYSETIVPEAVKVPVTVKGRTKWQRPFISALTSLQGSENHFGLTSFDGSVKVLDLEQKAIVREWKEHKQKVWTVESVQEHILASGGEDRTIKFWDLRQPEQSVHTIADHVGQVTSMLGLDKNTLVAGTCPVNAMQGGNGAEIRFYDVRK